MSRHSRRTKQGAKLRELEREFERKFVNALRRCAAGVWGLFGQNSEALSQASPALTQRLASTEAAELLALGEEIQNLRLQIGIAEAFNLHARFMEVRAMRGPNIPGEPNLARNVLDELNAASAETPRARL